MNQQSIILLAEDDDGHASLVERNLKRAGVPDQIVRAKDGQEALDYLFASSEGGVSYSPRAPRAVLLDINMPRIDGIEVLRKLKNHDSYRGIPVIMLTTTDDPNEIQRCYDLGCNAYVTKPIDYCGFVEAITSIGMFLRILVAGHFPTQSTIA